MQANEKVVAKVNDLQDGEMKQIAIEETDILLARVDGKFYAVGAYCTHYGAPLVEGALNGERIVCPWHHACFSVFTGDHVEPPGLDALTPFPVRVEGQNVIVSLPEEVDIHRIPPMVKRNPAEDGRTFIILGAGAAGSVAAETLRQDGFQGRILMITLEDRVPYDRPNLSKGYLQGKSSSKGMALRSQRFYQEYDIELLRKKEVVRVDAAEKTIAFADGDSLVYDALLLATGGKARQLNVPGTELQNLFTLRTFADADCIIAAAEIASNAVVIGASFIGMEVAASLTEYDLLVTVVAPESIPFERILGEEVGRMLQHVYEDHGIAFKLGSGVKQFEGSGKVEAVTLESGEQLEADLVIVGIGIVPVTDFLQGIELDPEDGSVLVDRYLHAGKDVYAAGDIARFPDWRTGEMTRIEHWRLAKQHGRIAAHNMAGKTVAYEGIPFFWTEYFGNYLQYVGHAATWDEIIYAGDPFSKKGFIAYYVKDNEVLAAAGRDRDRDLAIIEELLRQERMPTPEELRGKSVDLMKRLKEREAK